MIASPLRKLVESLQERIEKLERHAPRICFYCGATGADTKGFFDVPEKPTCAECYPKHVGVKPAPEPKQETQEEQNKPRAERERCKECRGDGVFYRPGLPLKQCKACHGTGVFPCPHCKHGTGRAQPADAVETTVSWCPQCGPEPLSDEDGCCQQCGATIGKVPDWRKIRAECDSLRAELERIGPVCASRGIEVEKLRRERDAARGDAMHVRRAHFDVLTRAEKAETELAAARQDVTLAASELLVECPLPGSDMARMMLANTTMRRECSTARTELDKATKNAFEAWAHAGQVQKERDAVVAELTKKKLECLEWVRQVTNSGNALAKAHARDRLVTELVAAVHRHLYGPPFETSPDALRAALANYDKALDATTKESEVK